jgi:putative membrane protein
MMNLSAADRARVEAAVAAAERRTSARFSLVVAHEADDYAPYPMLWAAALALILGDIAALAWPEVGTWWIVALQAALFVVADLLLHVRPLRYRLVPRRVKKSHAQRLARLQFAALVHDRTPGDVGLLLFVAEAERHVEILADRGIDQHVDQAAWDRIVADFVALVRAGALTPALTGAVEACAAILERHFPARPDAAGVAPDRLTEI